MSERTTSPLVRASAIVPAEYGRHVRDFLHQDLTEHELEAEDMGDGRLIIRHEGCLIELDLSPLDELRIRLTAPSDNGLFFLKEAAAKHALEAAPSLTESFVWSDADTAGMLPTNFRELRLLRRQEVMAGLIRLTFAAKDLDLLSDDGLHVKFLLPPKQDRAPCWPKTRANGLPVWPEGEDALAIRYYTIRNLRRSQGEIDIDVVIHPGGRVSDWAMRADPGDLAGMLGPGGGGIPGDASHLLIAGDMTAMPAIARILETIGSDRDGTALLQLPEGADPSDYLAPGRFDVETVASAAGPTGLIDRLTQKLRRGDVDQAWYGGEKQIAQDARRLFKASGLKGSRQLSVAYWQNGRPLDAR
ncbi:NADPH-dependent ferric siderophore reductase, contains FAD-binding and SIP domains [Fulvimarina manganoxydans]|uniref:NADPH-dependent ferric siderophore reductase, contains FAD-binding and SIP domains n=1 Tax=Fulvimarina manganoxydans TaxID=937218 RepID=A0A1W2ENC0_9HYPH|nr:siderophore-interacting protein [Fulvimarina manganoxydans]SMD10628.1 NADPH-dependent ferric siderophore reductase, contains FAD-binding and SIP domains [Fulvimarina manganoxydans]